MIFADKLIQLRKKNGWTQEELAEKMAVSRQSITKWEGAQSVPELTKLVKLSALFGVSLDYLLKDEIDVVEHMDEGQDELSCPHVSMEQANRFLDGRREAARRIAIATLLCILSFIPLFILGTLSELPNALLSEDAGGGIGLSIMFIILAIATVIFIKTGSANEPYEYLEKTVFETEYGVDGMVRERSAQFKPTYDRFNIIGTVLCMCAAIPLFIGAALGEDNDGFMVTMLCAMFVLAGIGVTFYIRGGVVWASFEKLLQQGDYTKQKKREENAIIGAISTAYWLIAVAAYLGWSFLSNNWMITWIVWPIAGVLYPAMTSILHAVLRRES